MFSVVRASAATCCNAHKLWKILCYFVILALFMLVFGCVLLALGLVPSAGDRGSVEDRLLPRALALPKGTGGQGHSTRASGHVLADVIISSWDWS